MPGPRQQRTNNARGTLPAGVVAYAPEVVWQIIGVGISTVTLDVSIPAPLLVIKDIPQFVRSDGNETPVSCVADGNHLLLTYPSPNSAGVVLTLGQRDPGVRTSQGGYLAPGVSVLPGPPQTEVVFIENGQNLNAQTGVYNSITSGTIYLGDQLTLGETKWVAVNAFAGSPCTVQSLTGAPPNEPVSNGEIKRFVWDGTAWVYAP